MRQARFLFLGTGASTGVPVLGCKCSVCTSSSSYNQRYRVSGLIKVEDRSFLIDVSPDFRLQAFRAALFQLDGVLITHTHYDHIAGLDDLRPLCFGRKEAIDCLVSRETLKELQLRYHYLMHEDSSREVPYTKLKFQVVENDFGESTFAGLPWRYVSYSQMDMKVTGYVIGSLAYISDIKEYTEELLTALQGVKVLILGALRYEFSKNHFSIDEAIAFARKVGAKQTYLTHIGHELDHEITNQQLPLDVSLAYDGLEIAFEVS